MRPLATLYRVALGGLGLSVVALVVYCFDALRWINDVNTFMSTGDVASGFEAMRATSAVNGALTFVYVAHAVAAICFIVWFFNAYKNLEIAGVPLRYTRGWAIGAWFVPFLSLVRPKQIADDVWRGSNAGAADAARDVRVTPTLHWWWGLYIGGSICFALGVREAKSLGSSTDSFEHVLSIERGGFYLTLLGAAAMVGAAVLIAICAHRITQAQDAGLDSEGSRPTI